jgi:hypothetical protein
MKNNYKLTIYDGGEPIESIDGYRYLKDAIHAGQDHYLVQGGASFTVVRLISMSALNIDPSYNARSTSYRY